MKANPNVAVTFWKGHEGLSVERNGDDRNHRNPV